RFRRRGLPPEATDDRGVHRSARRLPIPAYPGPTALGPDTYGIGRGSGDQEEAFAFPGRGSRPVAESLLVGKVHRLGKRYCAIWVAKNVALSRGVESGAAQRDLELLNDF